MELTELECIINPKKVMQSVGFDPRQNSQSYGHIVHS